MGCQSSTVHVKEKSINEKKVVEVIPTGQEHKSEQDENPKEDKIASPFKKKFFKKITPRLKESSFKEPILATASTQDTAVKGKPSREMKDSIVYGDSYISGETIASQENIPRLRKTQ